MSLRSASIIFEKTCFVSMISLFSKFSIICIVFSKLFFWIKIETLKIFFDLWLCVFAQRTNRQKDVVWVVNFSKIFLNFFFFFLTMIFFLTSMNFKYVFEFFSIRKEDHSLRLLFVVVTAFEYLRFQKN
jgi:hypothetical protein